MKLTIAIASLVACTQAFAPVARTAFHSTSLNNVAEDFNIPCSDECAMESYPNLPDTIHPGVVSGQALVDLLDHAKTNGKIVKVNPAPS